MVAAAADGAMASTVPAAPLPGEPPPRPPNGHATTFSVSANGGDKPRAPHSSPNPASSPGAPQGTVANRTHLPAISPPADGRPRLERVEFLITSTPVEGCELVPYVVIRTAAGEAKSAEAIEAKTRGALSVQYRWNRYAATYICARRVCLRPAKMQFVPLLKIADERVLTPEQFDLVVKESFFCGAECLQKSWPTLRSLQNKFSKSFPPRDRHAIQASDDAIERSKSHFVPGRSDGVFASPLNNPYRKTEVAWIRNYAPTVEDVGSILELVCRYVHRSAKDSNVDIGPAMITRSKHVRHIPDPPLDRRMLNLTSRELYSTNTRRQAGTFRVLTYNVLAEIYTAQQTYPNCPNWALAWTYRKRNLIREIAKYDADILCLQEVQADHYDDHFSPYFQRLGYQGSYKVKTRESMGRKGKIDGCATLFRKDMFVLRVEHSAEYNAIAQQRTKNSRALNRCLKGNVALILVLDAIDGSGPIVVANTHLFWDPDLTDVKLFQVDAFLQELEVVLQKHRLGPDVPIIIGGDFNSEPMSSVYEYLTTGLCSMTRSDVPSDAYGVLSTCNLRHGLHLRSAYSLLGTEPEFTNYTTNFVGVLDYLWYSPESVMPTAVLEIPEESQLMKDPEDDCNETKKRSEGSKRLGIPNTQWSSDHIALMIEFQLMKPRHTMSHARI